VDPHVPVEVPALAESQQAQLTLIRLFTRVDAQVLRQGRAVRESLLAESTPTERQALDYCVRGGRSLQCMAWACLTCKVALRNASSCGS
jgi:hypothetical protein